MKININLISKNKKIKKLLILVSFMFLCFFIHSCSVQAFSLEQVPSFLNDYSFYDIVCQSGKTNNNGDSELNCDFLGGNPISSWQDVDGNSILFPGYLTHWTLLKRYVTLIKTPGNGNGNIRLIFSSMPLSVSCHSSNSSIPFICELGTYRNNTFNKYNEFSTTRVLTSFVGLKNGSTSYGFNVVEEPGTYGSLWSDSYSNSNYYYNNVNVKDFIFANYDLYFLHDNSTVYSNYDFVNWSSFDEFVDSDNRNWFQKIVDGIVNIPNVISKWGRDLVNVGSTIIDGLKSLLIPDSSMLNDTLSNEFTYLQNRLGFLMYPITLLTDFSNRFFNIPDNGSAIFTIPNVSFMGTNLISETSIDLLNVVHQESSFEFFYNIYKTVVSGLIVLWIGKLAYSKFNETIGGGNSDI